MRKLRNFLCKRMDFISESLRLILMDPDENMFLKTIIGSENYKTRCRKCNLKGSEETPMHLFKDCLAVWRERLEYLGAYTFEDDEHTEWNPHSLLGFFKNLDLEKRPN